MEEQAKGVTKQDLTRSDKEDAERAKEYKEKVKKNLVKQMEKPTFDLGTSEKKQAADSSKGLPTTKKLWEEGEGFPEKRDPFKYVSKAKKQKVLKMLQKAGFKVSALVDKDLYMKLKTAEDSLKALWTALSEKGDPLTSVEQQREIEGLLQKIQQWHKTMTTAPAPKAPAQPLPATPVAPNAPAPKPTGAY